MKSTYLCISSEEYLPYYRELYKSIKEWSPNSKQILYYIGNRSIKEVSEEFDQVFDLTQEFNECKEEYNTLERICSLRARVVLQTFDKGNKQVIFCGAKIKFFSYPTILEGLLDIHDAVVTPHILEPLPDDGKFPSNSSVSFTGHISTDLVGFKDTPEIREFLIWQDKIMKSQCKTTKETYLDQSWLNFLPFFVDYVKILKDPAYNVAYWNYKQRGLEKFEDYWTVKNPHGIYPWSLVCFQFSGLDLNNPKNISTHQNRYKADGDFLEFLKDYAEKVK